MGNKHRSLRLGWWDKLPNWLIVALTLLVVLGVGGGTAAITSNGSSRRTGSESSGETIQPESKPPPVKAVFLSELTPSGGDPVSSGDGQIAGRDFPHSLMYENYGSKQSVASSCSAEPYQCHATSFELPGSYQLFTATVSVAERNNYNPVLHWQVWANGHILKQSKVASGTAAPIHVELNGARSIELRVILEELFNEPTVIWGDALVTP
jgi:hypothetical protein